MACATGSASTKKADWIGKSWDDSTYYYFSGISSGCPEIAQARQQAYGDALVKAAEFLGVRIDNKTIYNLSNDSSHLDAQTKLEISDTFFEQAKIKEFIYDKTDNGNFVGYVLLEVKKNVIAAEKNRKEKERAERIKLLENRKNSTPVFIEVPENLSMIGYSLKEFLQNEGFVFAQEGSPIKIVLIDENFNIVKGIYSCNLEIAISFENKTKTYSARGFGSNREQSKLQAQKECIKKIKKNFLD
jgi:hypothetical protein